MPTPVFRLVALSLIFLPSLAHAWGPSGHRIVAQLAQQRLSPSAHAQVLHLLASTGDHSLADVATWADELRDDPSQRTLARATAPLHFVNFASSTCRYDPPRDCPGGHCVVGAIETYARVLGDHSRPDWERAVALRFIVHFVADAHQPLHAGYRHDRGGNRYQIQWNGRGTNLHAIWDTPVLGSRHLGWRTYVKELGRTPLPVARGTPAQWAEESCRMTRDDGIYPRGHRLDATYLVHMRPLAERRVREAAARLAELLERTLSRR